MTTTALTIAERARTAIGLPNEIEQQLHELAKRTSDIVVIVSPEDRTQVHGALMTIKNQRIAIENAGKVARDDANKFAKAVIAEAGRLCSIIEPEEGRLFDLRKKWDDKIEADKQSKIAAELKRVADHQERIVYLNGCPNLSSLDDPALIAGHISDLEAEVVDESMEEFQERATAAKAAGVARLQALHAAALARVAEVARIAEERAELAKVRADQVERERVERERLAEEERQAKAIRDAEAAKQAAELNAAREKQEAEAAAERKRIADDAAAAKVIRDAEAAELKLAQEKAQAIIDAENARVAAENKAAADKLAADRAELERRQADERKVKQEEEARRAEQARIAALVRPSDEEMIEVLAIHYSAPNNRVVEWILSMDLSGREEAAA